MSEGPLDVLERMLETRQEPDDILRAAVQALAAEPGVAWAGIAFLDEGSLVLGPGAGEPDEARRTRVPIEFQGSTVGELWADGEVDRTVLERAATLLSGHVLIGWDTFGETWDP